MPGTRLNPLMLCQKLKPWLVTGSRVEGIPIPCECLPSERGKQKPQIGQHDDSAYANYMNLKSTIQMQSHLLTLGLLIIQNHGCYGE